ncbi:FxSxx-COOH system tetratricopeptide repeat protein [Saccharothrix texasensis]|uniref:Tetratricopeptide repeat protein n=1 Tax=Saccharothrix texasensis TaxID=103734 RepID=A0A3N1H3J5_9PSEU|nr:FxSxx-COOH system tetratricopeptide repeat protein [Saccharothrix texasensis]ROP37093.1 tetratricopeptide repeat protein [Saccharothrix texasensis]
MRRPRGALVTAEVALVFLTGLAINAASEHLPRWMTVSWVVWPVLVAVLGVTLAVTLRREPAGPSLPPVWSVPPRNPNFTGRAEEQRWLRDRLKRDRNVSVHAMRGMGGVGKSQVVIEFCHRRAGRYRAVWWITAEDAALVPGQLALLGRALGLTLPANVEESVGVVLAELRRRRDWLLVFDNAETVSGVRRYLPSGAGHVLVTTRRAGFEAIAAVRHVDTFRRPDSVSLLRRRVPAMSDGQADELAELLGDLPLALEQAAAYLQQTSTPVPDYLDRLRRSPDTAADRGRDAHRTPDHDTLASLWELPLRLIEESFPASARLLEICSYLASEAIPLDLFADNASALPQALESAVADRSGEFADTVGVLVDYSLLRRVDDSVRVHRMVQLAVRARVAGLPPAAGAHPQAVAAGLLVADLRERHPRSTSAWPRWRLMLPHVLACVGFDVDPRVGGWLLGRAGAYLFETGQLNDARLLFTKALEGGEAAFGPDHPGAAVHLSNLGVVLSELGQPERARPFLDRALALTEAAYGPHHPAVAVRLNNLGLALHDLRRPGEALPLMQRALAITEAAYGPDRPIVALRLDNLGLVMRDLAPEHVQEAEALHRRALAITEAAHGPDHPDVARALHNLGAALVDRGYPLDARRLFERALAVKEAAYGLDHPEVAGTLSDLAMVLRRLHSPADDTLLVTAQALLTRSLTISEAVFGGDHPVVAVRLGNLGLVLSDLGRAGEATRLHERALAIAEAAHGADHPDVTKHLDGLAGAWRAQGHPDLAIPLMERALKITEAWHRGDDHHDVATRLSRLGLALSLMDREDEAGHLITRARAMRARLRA